MELDEKELESVLGGANPATVDELSHEDTKTFREKVLESRMGNDSGLSESKLENVLGGANPAAVSEKLSHEDANAFRDKVLESRLGKDLDSYSGLYGKRYAINREIPKKVEEVYRGVSKEEQELSEDKLENVLGGANPAVVREELSQKDTSTFREKVLEDKLVDKSFLSGKTFEGVTLPEMKQVGSELSEGELEHVLGGARPEVVRANMPQVSDELGEDKLEDVLGGAPKEVINDKALGNAEAYRPSRLEEIQREKEALKQKREAYQAAYNEYSEKVR